MKTVKADQVLRASIGVLLVVFVFVIFDSFHEKVVTVGDSAPGFSIKTDNGRTLSTDNFGGRLLVLNFWATWCATCIEELPSLDQFQRRFASSGVVVLGVSIDKDEKAYRNFLDRVRVSFLTARDPGNNINVDYGTFKVPETYIIDTKGKVLQKIVGPENWSDERVVSLVKSLLNT